MSIKHYCDICKEEISRNYVSNRYTKQYTGGTIKDNQTKQLKSVPFIKLEVMVTMDSVANKGDLCLKCLKELLLK